jgi:hypothetical protein
MMIEDYFYCIFVFTQLVIVLILLKKALKTIYNNSFCGFANINIRMKR